MKTTIQLPTILGTLASTLVNHAEQLISSSRIDGQIIGTGKADFTQGNVTYGLNFGERSFQLVDVPGIEGDESRFIDLVRSAVAKAHLIVYVNGTNKKPEKKTAEKIKDYLRRGSKVYPLVNIRGGADAYEFEEDRIALINNDAKEIIKQTAAVLSRVLGSKALLPSHGVQGLIGFCALAYDAETSSTTIHPDRDNSLGRHQKNYLKHFGSTSSMLDFSEIQAIADVVKGKLDTYREDIIESNKDKVKQLISNTIEILTQSLNEQNAFISKMKPEFTKCRNAIREAVKSFERIALSGQKNTYNKVFNELMDASDDIVEQYFGEADQIKTKIERTFDKLSAQAEKSLAKQMNDNLQDLSQKVQNAVKRLLEDMQRVELEQKLTTESFNDNKFSHAKNLGWNLGLSDLGSFAFQVGSYALSGAAIGSPFGGLVGATIGAIAGAVLGLIMGLLNLFSSKEKRIRKAQAEVREKIEQVQDDKMTVVEESVAELMAVIKAEVDTKTLTAVNTLERNLKIPVSVLEKQIAVLSNIMDQVKGMPYGTIKTF